MTEGTTDEDYEHIANIMGYGRPDIERRLRENQINIDAISSPEQAEAAIQSVGPDSPVRRYIVARQIGLETEFGRLALISREHKSGELGLSVLARARMISLCETKEDVDEAAKEIEQGSMVWSVLMARRDRICPQREHEPTT